MSKYWISTAAAAKVKVLVLLYIVEAWKVFGKITQSFGDISVVKGVVIFFFLGLLLFPLKNTLLKIQCSILVFLLTYHYWKSLFLMMISSPPLLTPSPVLFLRGKKLPRIPWSSSSIASCSVAPHFALSEEATIQLNIPHCVVRLQGSASE